MGAGSAWASKGSANSNISENILLRFITYTIVFLYWPTQGPKDLNSKGKRAQPKVLFVPVLCNDKQRVWKSPADGRFGNDGLFKQDVILNLIQDLLLIYCHLFAIQKENA
jgi:hypothetical protein